jgi:hypothetical protein
MEVILADKPDDATEVRIKMPAHLHDRLADFCARDNMKVEELVHDLINKWILGQTIAVLEANGESNEASTHPGSAGRG